MKDISDARLDSELATEIMSAQSCALAVQSEQFDLLQSKSELEVEIVRLKAWNTESIDTNFKASVRGANAYVGKERSRRRKPVIGFARLLPERKNAF